MKSSLVLALAFASSIVACGAPAAPVHEAPPIAAPPGPSATAAASNALAPTERIAIDGAPNGLAWDDESKSLFIADDGADAILRARDGKVSVYAKLPEPHKGLGAIAMGTGGVVVAVRFGRHDDGEVLVIDPAHGNTPLPGLDPKRRRLGLFIDKRGSELAVYVSYFSGHGKAGQGGVERVGLGGTAPPRDVVTGLDKPVGVAVIGDDLVVSDQGEGELLRGRLADPKTLAPVARIEAPDMLALAPDGTIFVASKSGVVRSVDAHGEVKAIGRVRYQARGVAYDAATHRLFVSDHDPAGKDNAVDVFTLR